MKNKNFKALFWLLTSYILFQYSALFFQIPLFLFVYYVIYITAIIYASILISRAVNRNNNLKSLMPTLSSFFVANLVLFLLYIPTLIYNPDINPTYTWKLIADGENQDSMILQAYLPPIFFCVAFAVLVLAALVAKFLSGYKRKKISEK